MTTELTDAEFDKIDGFVTIARRSYDKDNYRKAIKYYKKSLSDKLADPDLRVPLLAELGWCYYYTKKYKYAVQYFTEAIEWNNSFEDIFEVKLHLAHSYYASGEYENALIKYKELYEQLKEGVAELDVKYYIGVSYFQLGKIQQAKEWFQVFIKIKEIDVKENLISAYYYLGWICSKENDLQSAKRFYEYVVEHSEDSDLLKKAKKGIAAINMVGNRVR